MASEDLLKKAVAAFNALSPEQQAEMLEEQRQSWVRGNVGLSRDERGMTAPAAPVSPDDTEGPFEVSRSSDGQRVWFSARDPASGVSIPAKDRADARMMVTSLNNALAHHSRHKPDATGKCGELETVAVQHLRSVDGQWHYGEAHYSNQEERELVTRSQAEELLAAERAAKEAFAEEIKEAAYEAWPEASDVGSDAPDIIRQLGQERNECLAEVEDLKNKLYRAEADNAALTARVKELEQINAMIMGDDEDKPRYTTKRLKQEIANAMQVMKGEASDREAHVNALEAKLAAAEKAIEVYGPYTPTWLGPCVWAGIKEELPPQLVDKEVWISTSNPNEVKS
ncbi:MAG: hypothetical protein NBV76_05445 [Candidatus Ochrobactrum gambitense]|nr:MAG: hypothetical protein NBV76_05445 [Candidatus Ochrobactrum gambitense]WEK17183.1 MAG: hypothetical protein P0Y54_05515 [Candidatus Ochrobactrum gambitense]